MTKTIPCPACWHKETLAARLAKLTPTHADPAQMDWRPSYRWDGNQWVCRKCFLYLGPHDASVLLHAVLVQHSDLGDDSVVDWRHGAIQRALEGGPEW